MLLVSFVEDDVSGVIFIKDNALLLLILFSTSMHYLLCVNLKLKKYGIKKIFLLVVVVSGKRIV